MRIAIATPTTLMQRAAEGTAPLVCSARVGGYSGATLRRSALPRARDVRRTARIRPRPLVRFLLVFPVEKESSRVDAPGRREAHEEARP